MNFIDSFLNKITMYKLVLYSLTLLAAVSIVLSFFGMVSANPFNMFVSLVIIFVSVKLSNLAFSKLFSAPTNIESEWITAFILFLTLAPPATLAEGLYIAFGGIVAMASKYLLAIRKKHVFNPAAFALFVLSITGTGLSAWWVGTPALLPFVAVLGLLVVRKIRRFDVFFSFLLSGVAVLSLLAIVQGLSLSKIFTSMILSGPLIFFGTIMVTEPLTMPPVRWLRIVFGIIVGSLFASQFRFGPVYPTPQLALLFGNLYAYLVSSKQKLLLTFESVKQLSASVYEFAFRSDKKLNFLPGQYLEWTLPHAQPDSRGNRRYFTIASSPTGNDIRLGIRYSTPSSSFKHALMSMTQGDKMVASSLAGDFTLPEDPNRKLVFIAGGVGITPFASMLRYLLDKNETRDVVMFYAAATEQDFAYKEILEEAREKFGTHIIYLAGSDRLTEDRIQEQIEDLSSRTYYLSGPNAMVESYKKLLRGMAIPRKNIVTDYFPGF